MLGPSEVTTFARMLLMLASPSQKRFLTYLPELSGMF